MGGVHESHGLSTDGTKGRQLEGHIFSICIDKCKKGKYAKEDEDLDIKAKDPPSSPSVL